MQRTIPSSDGFGSGSKTGLNSRPLLDRKMHKPQEKKEKSEYDAQIYMTIGQADPHPSHTGIQEMSGSVPLDSSQRSFRSGVFKTVEDPQAQSLKADSFRANAQPKIGR